MWLRTVCLVVVGPFCIGSAATHIRNALWECVGDKLVPLPPSTFVHERDFGLRAGMGGRPLVAFARVTSHIEVGDVLLSISGQPFHGFWPLADANAKLNTLFSSKGASSPGHEFLVLRRLPGYERPSCLFALERHSIVFSPSSPLFISPSV